MNKEECCHGPGYSTPLDAMKTGSKEKILYTVTVQPNLNEMHGDYLSTIDVDPDSASYCQIIHRTFTNHKGDELHHSGWNACSSCYNVDQNSKRILKRNRLILPAVNSDNIYILDAASNPLKPEIIKVIDGKVLKSHNVTAPHTTHCLADGNILISTMGDAEGNAKGEFLLFDSDFNCIGPWIKGDKKPLCGYDFWYQPYFDVMVSSEWGAPKKFRRGWKNEDMNDLSQYGCRINFFKWSSRTLIQTIDLGLEGFTPLEIRFMHNPMRAEGYVGCGLFSNVFYFKRKENSDKFESKKVIDIPTKLVQFGEAIPQEIGGMISDIILSLDDRFLYINLWRYGDIRQYNVTNPDEPILTGQVYIGGALCDDLLDVKIIKDSETDERPKPVYIKGKRLEGGPQMMQLSLDGKRLYVSTSLFSTWDKMFYPKMVEKGGHICLIDINTEVGGMTLNTNFFVDFGKEPYGPTLPHEMRFPGGDCTSDIWLANQS